LATGPGGVPSSGVSAVVLNLTVVAPTSNGSVVAYESGTARPSAVSVYYRKGQTISGMTVAAVDATNHVNIYSSAYTQLVAVVDGYFSTPATASAHGLFNPVTPARLLDTRLAPNRPLGPHGALSVPVTGVAGVPATGVSAVLVNTKAVGPSTGGYLSTYPSGKARPTYSTLQFATGQTVANRAIVSVGTGGKIAVYNNTGTTNVAVDITGYFTTTGGYYVPVTPTRTHDTRPNTAHGTFLGGHCLPCPWIPQIAGLSAPYVPATDAVAPTIAVATTVTAFAASGTPGSPLGAGYLRLYPSGGKPGAATDVNFPGNAAVSNAAFVALGVDGAFGIQSSVENTYVGVDLFGYFQRAAPVPTPSGVWTWRQRATGAVPDWAVPVAELKGANALHGIVALTDSEDWNDALLADGTVWQWRPRVSKPVRVGTLSAITAIAAGAEGS
jgi:hypothetical protein